LENADAFSTPPTAIIIIEVTIRTNQTPRLRAHQKSDDTETAYRVAAFQPFLSGRI